MSRAGEIIDLGVKLNLIDKAGAWYSCNGDRIGQGKENVRQHLLDNPELMQRLEADIREALMPKPKTVEDESQEADANEG